LSSGELQSKTREANKSNYAEFLSGYSASKEDAMELAGMLFTLASQVLGSLVKAKIEAGKKKILEEEVRRAVSSELAKLRHDIQVNVDVVEVLVGEVYSLAGSTPSARVHGREIIVSRRNRLMALSPIRERQLTKKVQRLRSRVSGLINGELKIDGKASLSADSVPEVSIVGQSGEESLSGSELRLRYWRCEHYAA
jgi:hypothetical protein